MRGRPAYGVGLVYTSGLEPVLDAYGDLVDVLEIEPQTFWKRVHRPAPAYDVDPRVVERLRSLPFPKILHGIGFPVGGTRPPHDEQVPPLRRMIDAFEPRWMSEHLSFNRTAGPEGEWNTGFLLPPRQSAEGVEAAVASIRTMRRQVGIPLAFETGVNYLRPRADEMSDGAFVAAVAEGADCGILLDLHNVWTNERNGRQPVAAFLDEVPLERVWEVHLAGGEEREGYWIDSHCGAVPGELVALAREVLPRLPGLGAIVFEIFPSYLATVGPDVVGGQLRTLRELWDLRGRDVPRPRAGGGVPRRDAAAGPGPGEWERALAEAVLERGSGSRLSDELAGDPGVPLVRGLLEEFRLSMLVEALRLTSRLLLMTLGEPAFREIVRQHWRSSTPEPFASEEASRFADFLGRHAPAVPYLPEVLAYERAVLAAVLDGERTVVPFRWDPLVVLRSLADGRLPGEARAGNYEVEVTPEGAPDGDAGGARLLH